MYNIFILHLINHSRLTIVVTELTKNIIEEGWREKQRQRSSCLFGGPDFNQFLAALAVLPRSIWKKRMNSSDSSKSTEAKCFCLHPSSPGGADSV